MKSTKEFTIKCLGEQELEVYDLEVEDNHNFYGNNILLHNSLFINTTDMLKNRFGDDYEKTSMEDKRSFCILIWEKLLSKCVQDYYKNYTEALNFRNNTFEMDFEVIADKSIIIGKKRYVMNVVYDDGDLYSSDNTKLKIRGVEINRTNSPMIVRKKLEELVRLIINTKDNDVCLKFITDFRKEFDTLPFEMVAKPTGVKGMTKYDLGQKGIPIHVRAAKIYNKALSFLELNTFSPISDGDKIKYCYIKKPNVFKSNVIAALEELPEEIRKKIPIDYETQFDKTCMSPAKIMFDALNWKTEKTASLESFF